jgi:hypothetical protein
MAPTARSLSLASNNPNPQQTSIKRPKNDVLPLSARNMFDNERFRELARRQSYYDCTQHDTKRFDFDGRIIPITGNTANYNVSGEKFGGYVPLKMRRPSAPYRLGRAFVSAFTNLLFGEQRFPLIRTEGDPKSQDFHQTLAKVSQLPVKMIRARNIGGSVGTAGLSWAFIDGKPRVNVHNGKNLFVHEWEDRDQLVPAHLSEFYMFFKDEIDPLKRRIVRNQYIYRRDWSLDEEIVFKPVKFEPGIELLWQPDRWVTHNDGICHFVWIQNMPHEEVDGLPDYHGLYENFDDLDILLSVITRGAVLNLDPTLKLKMDIEQVIRMGVKKGSDNALAVGKEGDAAYLELAGTSITAGIGLFNAKRNLVLETGECVFPDPDKVAAGGLSSVAQKAMYQRMLGKGDIMREQYGTVIERLIEQMSRVARANYGQSIENEEDVDETNEGTDQDEGSAAVGKSDKQTWTLVLPPKVTKEQPIDPETGALDHDAEPIITKEEREPGEGGDVHAKWGPWFPPTPDDRAKEATTLQIATGMQPFISTQTATEQMAQLYGIEPEEELLRVSSDKKVADAKQAQMFADKNGAMGGKPPPFSKKPADDEEPPPNQEKPDTDEKPEGTNP